MLSSHYQKRLNGQYKKLPKNRPKNRNNNCTLLVCSDIFGINPALEAFFRDWQGELLLLSPYAKQQHFSNDEQAYQYFLQHGGLDSYRQKLRQTLHQLATAQQTVLAVGFSAGAAALWCELSCEPGGNPGYEPGCGSGDKPGCKVGSQRVSEQVTNSALATQAAPGLQFVRQAFCFYGGQIRHFAELSPCCPTTFIWAQEPHFDVKALSGVLAQKHHVSSYISHYQHGFINPKSAGYHKQGAAYYQRWFMAKLHK